MNQAGTGVKKKTRRKMIIGVGILVVALGFLGYRGFMSARSYSYKIDEFLAIQTTLADKTVRLAGSVAPGSVEQSGLSLKFDITDGQNSISVVYKGVVPDTFKAGGEVIVEGRIDGTGTFVAQTLLTKCASKYEPV